MKARKSSSPKHVRSVREVLEAQEENLRELYADLLERHRLRIPRPSLLKSNEGNKEQLYMAFNSHIYLPLSNIFEKMIAIEEECRKLKQILADPNNTSDNFAAECRKTIIAIADETLLAGELVEAYSREAEGILAERYPKQTEIDRFLAEAYDLVVKLADLEIGLKEDPKTHLRSCQELIARHEHLTQKLKPLIEEFNGLEEKRQACVGKVNDELHIITSGVKQWEQYKALLPWVDLETFCGRAFPIEKLTGIVSTFIGIRSSKIKPITLPEYTIVDEFRTQCLSVEVKELPKPKEEKIVTKPTVPARPVPAVIPTVSESEKELLEAQICAAFVAINRFQERFPGKTDKGMSDLLFEAKVVSYRDKEFARRTFEGLVEKELLLVKQTHSYGALCLPAWKAVQVGESYLQNNPKFETTVRDAVDRINRRREEFMWRKEQERKKR